MKTKLTAFILTAALTLALAGCAGEPEPTEPKDTPVRVGEWSSQVELVSPVSLEAAIDEADLIVDLTVTEWLGENIEIWYTVFSAQINNVIKGDIEEGEEITFRQSGTSRSTIRMFPLYKIGDRLLLFLKTPSPVNFEGLKQYGHEKTYEMIGVYALAYDIWEHDGKTYLLDRLGIGNEWYFNPYGINRIESVDNEVTEIVVENFIDSDPVIEEMVGNISNRNLYQHSFRYDDVVEKFEEIMKIKDE